MTPELLASSGSEDAHQAALFNWAWMASRHGFEAARDMTAYEDFNTARTYGEHNKVICLELLHHVPNGGKRDKRTAAKLKATGVKAGVPDIYLDVARGGFHGLRIELKRPATAGKREGITSADQKRWMSLLQEQSYYAVACVGWQEASKHLEHYLTL